MTSPSYKVNPQQSRNLMQAPGTPSDSISPLDPAASSVKADTSNGRVSAAVWPVNRGSGEAARIL